MDRNFIYRIWRNDTDIKPWRRTIFWTIATLIFITVLAAIVVPVFYMGFWRYTDLDSTENFPIVDPPEFDPRSDFLICHITVQSFDLQGSRFSFQLNIVDSGAFAFSNNTLKKSFTVITPGFEKVAGGRKDYIAGKDALPVIIQDALYFDQGDPDQYPWDVYRGRVAIRVVDPADTSKSIPVRGYFRGQVQGFYFYNPERNSDTGNNFQKANPAYQERQELIEQQAKQGIKRMNNEPDSLAGVVFEFGAVRSSFVRTWSVFVVILMWILSITQLGITLQVAFRGRDFNPVLLPFGATFLFSLPALRNSQPSIPPIGVAADALGFYYNMFFIVLAILLNISCYLKSWAPRPIQYQEVRAPV